MPVYDMVPLEIAHAGAVGAIMGHHARNGFASYWDDEVPEEAVARQFTGDSPPAGFAVRTADQVVGFGLIKPYMHPAPAFRRTGELTYFLLPEAAGQGVGTRLLDALVALARRQGRDRLLANVNSLNAQSLAFHRRRGFTECGRFPAIGVKHGQVFDVVWMIRRLDTP